MQVTNRDLSVAVLRSFLPLLGRERQESSKQRPGRQEKQKAKREQKVLSHVHCGQLSSLLFNSQISIAYFLTCSYRKSSNSSNSRTQLPPYLESLLGLLVRRRFLIPSSSMNSREHVGRVANQPSHTQMRAASQNSRRKASSQPLRSKMRLLSSSRRALGAKWQSRREGGQRNKGDGR